MAQVFYSYQKSLPTQMMSSSPQSAYDSATESTKITDTSTTPTVTEVIETTTCTPKKAKLLYTLSLLEREQKFFKQAVQECNETENKNKEHLSDLEEKITNISQKIKDLFQTIKDLSVGGIIELEIELSVYSAQLKKATEERDDFLKVSDTDKKRCNRYRSTNERNDYAIQQVKKELEDPRIC
ncbi:hypothetical protein RF11_02544 [Thelohanellus kitauei]|uniref:Uncharacterized protein n=1 Tax=Thelohanellus kitauei TaxID=669202 RepID=A0A0C2MR13_THEKT|nr:hypothetical protein RF11_02544 [Thelohanellus kitauei]